MDTTSCPICLERFVSGRDVSAVRCGHVFPCRLSLSVDGASHYMSTVSADDHPHQHYPKTIHFVHWCNHCAPIEGSVLFYCCNSITVLNSSLLFNLTTFQHGSAACVLQVKDTTDWQTGSPWTVSWQGMWYTAETEDAVKETKGADSRKLQHHIREQRMKQHLDDSRAYSLLQIRFTNHPVLKPVTACDVQVRQQIDLIDMHPREVYHNGAPSDTY